MKTKSVPLTYDALMESGIFQPNHLNPNAGFGYGDGNGFLYETYGAEYDAVVAVSEKQPHRIATIIEAEGELYLARGWHFVNRLGYFIAKRDLPEFDELPLDDEIDRMERRTLDAVFALNEALNLLQAPKAKDVLEARAQIQDAIDILQENV